MPPGITFQSRTHLRQSFAYGKIQKILFLTHSLGFGGAERQLALLASRLPARGYEVIVATFTPGGPFTDALRTAGVRLIALRRPHRRDAGRLVGNFIRLLVDERPDIVHSYLVMPNLAATAARIFAPNTCIVWGVRASNVDYADYDWLLRHTFKATRWFSRLVDLIVVNSHAGLEYHVAQGYPASKMRVVPNGIDTEAFRPMRQNNTLRQEWSLPESTPVVGIVGRLDTMKDHRTFLRAAALVRQKHQDVRFAVVGDGERRYKQSLVDLAFQLGLDDHVIWSAARVEPAAVYSAFDVAVSSSRWGEGFPNAVAEALACGVPTVSTDVGDAREIVADDRWIVPPGDADALALRIDQLLSMSPDERRALGLDRRAHIARDFSVNKLVELTEAALASACVRA